MEIRTKVFKVLEFKTGLRRPYQYSTNTTLQTQPTDI